MKLFARLWHDERGEDLIEYALMAGFIAVAAGAIFGTNVVPTLKDVLSKVEQSLRN